VPDTITVLQQPAENKLLNNNEEICFYGKEQGFKKLLVAYVKLLLNHFSFALTTTKCVNDFAKNFEKQNFNFLKRDLVFVKYKLGSRFIQAHPY
jgi:hypothetical protein